MERIQDGQTAEQWLDHYFSTEYCDCCGLDKEDHEAIVVFDNFFALCLFDPDQVGEEAYIQRYREVHGTDPKGYTSGDFS